jgi:hypothetical protein
MVPGRSFDAGGLLGRSEWRAAALTAARGCVLRLVNRDRHALAQLADKVSDRVDATVVDGIVTAVSVG